MEQIIEKQFNSFSGLERKWLSHVIWQLIKGDNWVAKGEYPYLHEAMKWVEKSEIELEEERSGSKHLSGMDPLKVECRNKAFKMVAFLIEVALSDNDLAIIEMSIIENAMSLLGFDEKAQELILTFAEELSQSPKYLKNPNFLLRG